MLHQPVTNGHSFTAHSSLFSFRPVGKQAGQLNGAFLTLENVFVIDLECALGLSNTCLNIHHSVTWTMLIKHVFSLRMQNFMCCFFAPWLFVCSLPLG